MGIYTSLVSVPIKDYMAERRFENRALCADLVQVEWKDKSGWMRTSTALLEDISPSGACLQMDVQIAPRTAVRLTFGDKWLESRVKYCAFREIGYFIGLEFPKTSPWSRRLFRPKHMLDLSSLVRNADCSNERQLK